MSLKEKQTILCATDSDKAKAFDEIASMFFDKNFGTASKAEIDLRMFKIFIEYYIEKNKKDDLIDYSDFSDYKLGTFLGLTPTQVRNLKLKKELKYPQPDFKWQKSFRNLLSDPTRIYKEGDNLKINIPDPNLFNAIQDYIEDLGGYIEMSLNSKLMTIPCECAMLLVEMAADENDWVLIKEKINEIPVGNTQTEEKRRFFRTPAENGKDIFDVLEQIFRTGKNAAEIFEIVYKAVSPASSLAKCLKNMLHII